MTGKINGTTDAEYICLFCPLPRCMSDSQWCPYNRFHRLKRCEERARQTGRRWISRRQVKKMLAEIGERLS